MHIIYTVLLGIIEGITEFLPISSTGHLILASKIFQVPNNDFTKSFEIIIQSGAILSVVFLYWRTLLNNRKAWIPIIIAFIPTGLLGLVFYKIIKHYLLGNAAVTLISLFIGGLILIAVEYFLKPKKKGIEAVEDIPLQKAIGIGLIQSISMIPGVSRSAASIIGAQLLGVSRETAVEFSFLLAIPTMAAATGWDLLKSNFSFDSFEYLILGIGFVTSFITALFAIKFFLGFVKKHTFIPFGIYRIVLAVLYWFIFFK